MATTKPTPTQPTTGLTAEQDAALLALHAYLDRQAVWLPGHADTAALREARDLRTLVETAFPAAFPAPSPIVTASG